MKKSIIVSQLFIAQISFAQPVVKCTGAMSNMGAENFKGNILIDTISTQSIILTPF
jgi:hypothetical protein